MTKRIGTGWVIAVFSVGLLLGAFGGALFVTWKVLRFETDAIVTAVAEHTFNLVPLVISLNTANEKERLEQFESAAHNQLNAGAAVLHSNLPVLSEAKRNQITQVLKSISKNRERLRLGQFDNPPKDHIEEILAKYAN